MTWLHRKAVKSGSGGSYLDIEDIYNLIDTTMISCVHDGPWLRFGVPPEQGERSSRSMCRFVFTRGSELAHVIQQRGIVERNREANIVRRH
jgi:hypothetical protein